MRSRSRWPFGPAAGLEIVDALASEPSLKGYHLLPSVRGDFLAKLGRFDEARAEFERAASLTRNARERELLLDRARAVQKADLSPGHIEITLNKVAPSPFARDPGDPGSIPLTAHQKLVGEERPRAPAPSASVQTDDRLRIT